MKRLGAVAAILLALGAIGFLLLRRPRSEGFAAAAPASEIASGRNVEPSPTRTAEATTDASRAVVETPPPVIVLAGTVVDVALGGTDVSTPASDVLVSGRKGRIVREQDLDPVRTDIEGRFRIEFRDPGTRPLDFSLFAASGEQLRGAGERVTLGPGQQQALGIRLERFPFGDLIGTTVDPSDRPLQGMLVTAQINNGLRETESDREGHFRFLDVKGVTSVDAKGAGYVMLLTKYPKVIREGGWEPVRIVLAPTAKLHLRVVDDQEHGISGVHIVPNVSRWEIAGRKAGDFDFRAELTAETDENGSAILEVWSGQRLSIEIASSSPATGPILRTYEYENEGTLCSGEAPASRPIVLNAGEEKGLKIVLKPGTLVRGHVVDESGEPAHPAFVTLEGPGGLPGRDRLRLQRACDEGGGFAFGIPPSQTIAAVRLRASDQGFSWAGGRIATLDVNLQSGPTSDLVLTLRAGLRIAGHVIALDGSGVSAEIVAKLQGEFLNLDPWGVSSNTTPDGSFEIKHLEPGSYELWVHPREVYRDTEVEDVVAGKDDLVVQLESKRSAHVTIEVRGRDGELGKWSLVNARVRPFRGASPPAPALPAETEYSEPGNLPHGVAGMLRGGAFSDEIGTLHCSVVKQDARSTQVDLDEGFYWFGAKGTDPDGRPFGSVGTGLVRVEAGDHKVRFVLAPAVAIEGRLVGEDVLRLQAGIARRGGRLLELDVGGEGLFPFRPVGADGSFAFAAVPVGENEIWIGTATELAAGKPARRQALTVEAKGVPFLEIAVR